MVDLRIQPSNIVSGDIPKIQMTDAQTRTLDNISASTSQDAARLQETSEKLYLASFEADARAAINEISERNKADPENLKKDLVESYKGFSENAPVQLRGMMAAQYEIMGRPALNNAVKFRTKINDDKLKETSLTNISEAFKTLEQNAAGMLSDDAHVAFDASRSAQLQMNTISSMSQTLTEGGVPLFSADQRVKFVENAKQSLVEAGVKGWFDQQPNKVKAYKDFLNGEKTFKLYNNDDELDTELDPLREMNRGTFEKVRNYMETQIKRDMKKVSDGAENVNFAEVMNDPNMLIDPKNRQQRKMVDQYFTQVISPQIANLNPEQRNDEITKYVSRVGIIPAEVQSVLRATLRSGSVENQTMSADLISKLQEVVPQSLHEVDGSDVSYGLMLTKSIRGGLTPDEAVSQTKENFNPLKQDLIKQRREDFKFLEIDSEEDLLSKFSDRPWSRLFLNVTGLPKDQASADQARIDYMTAYEEQYVQTGDQEIAQRRAADIIDRQYGVTKVSGGTRITKYPPENYYAVEGIDNEWMETQLVNDVRAQTGADVSLDDIALVADVETAREVKNNKKPGYVVMIRDETGAFNPVHKDRKLMRYFFDSSVAVEEHNARVEKENSEAVAKSKAEFKRKRENLLGALRVLEPAVSLAPLGGEKI